jgi:hypothetical protein
MEKELNGNFKPDKKIQKKSMEIINEDNLIWFLLWKKKNLFSHPPEFICR